MRFLPVLCIKRKGRHKLRWKRKRSHSKSGPSSQTTRCTTYRSSLAEPAVLREKARISMRRSAAEECQAAWKLAAKWTVPEICGDGRRRGKSPGAGVPQRARRPFSDDVTRQLQRHAPAYRLRDSKAIKEFEKYETAQTQPQGREMPGLCTCKESRPSRLTKTNSESARMQHVEEPHSERQQEQLRLQLSASRVGQDTKYAAQISIEPESGTPLSAAAGSECRKKRTP